MVLDEPLSNIDPITIEMIKDVIVKLQLTRSITIIISDHAFENVLQIADEVKMLINTTGIFPIWTESFIVPKGLSEKTVKLSKLSLLKGESIYSVITDLAPFRKGPENGSDVLFLLNEGEQLAISKVAGDRLYGRVRIYLEKQKSYNYSSGWILSKNVYLE